MGLFVVSLILLFSGIALTRLDFFEIKNPQVRSVAYWAHVITPVLAVWLYLLHRLAGPKIKWRFGLGWAGAVGVIVVAMVVLHAQDPRRWNIEGPKEGEKYFLPSLARTASGNLSGATLMMDSYCLIATKRAAGGSTARTISVRSTTNRIFSQFAKRDKCP